ncbi:MAG: sulfatase [Proteobacteria bacterium]|nr:sulfatase [Pseudomonadota bacterium]
MNSVKNRTRSDKVVKGPLRFKRLIVIVAWASLFALVASLVLIGRMTPKIPWTPRKAREPGAVDVILLTVDALRADFTNPYGETLPTTPFLSKLAAEGVTFTNAFAAAPWTVPSMFSIITGLYPTEHGLTSGQTVGAHVVGQNSLPQDAFTLTERLAEIGYSTFGINTNYHMAPQFGFNQGFKRYVGSEFTFLPFPNLAVDSFKYQIKATPKYFLWLHYLDPHFPYTTQSPWFGKWNDSRFRTLFDLSEEVALKYYWYKRGLPPNDPVDPDEVQLVHHLTNRLTHNSILLFHGLPKIKDIVDQDYIRFFKAAYKSTLRQTDEAMEKALQSLGVDDQTLLIFISDHGEELFERGQLGHRKNSSLYQELLRVPFIIRLPGGKGAGTVIDTQVSTLDIVPTVLEIIGQPIPDDLSGQSLVPLIEGMSFSPRPLFAEVSSWAGETRCIFEFPWKYMHNFTHRQSRLYNIEDDPNEMNDLFAQEKNRALEMHDRLVEWIGRTKPRWKLRDTVQLSPLDIRRLRQMGYVK